MKKAPSCFIFYIVALSVLFLAMLITVNLKFIELLRIIYRISIYFCTVYRGFKVIMYNLLQDIMRGTLKEAYSLFGLLLLHLLNFY